MVAIASTQRGARHGQPEFVGLPHYQEDLSDAATRVEDMVGVLAVESVGLFLDTAALMHSAGILRSAGIMRYARQPLVSGYHQYPLTFLKNFPFPSLRRPHKMAAVQQAVAPLCRATVSPCQRSLG